MTEYHHSVIKPTYTLKTFFERSLLVWGCINIHVAKRDVSWQEIYLHVIPYFLAGQNSILEKIYKLVWDRKALQKNKLIL